MILIPLINGPLFRKCRLGEIQLFPNPIRRDRGERASSASEARSGALVDMVEDMGEELDG